MKGTDVTDAQLAHAQDFLRSAAGGKFDPEFMETQKYVTVDKEDIIRLLAWYGSIRAKSGRETPNPLVHRCACANPGVDLMTGICDCVTPAEQSPCLCHFHVRFSSSGQTDSAEQPIRCGTFSETAIPNHSLQYALARVAERRAKQDAKHGGPAHDDTHSRSEWLMFLEDYVRRARYCENGETYEYYLIDVAALAVAAIQSSRRKRRDSERDNPENADPKGCA